MTMRTEKQKRMAGELYRTDAEITADHIRTRALTDAYNALPADDAEAHRTALVALFASVGENTVIRSPLFCDFGFNTCVGANVFINFGCILLDVVEIEIGDRTQIGPNVQILTADHPRDPVLRAEGLESGAPVRIGSNVWIGGGAIILPGVMIGDNAIVGAGSVVTRDVPEGVTVVGNPARPVPSKAVFA